MSRATRSAFQVLLALLGIAAFLLLLDVLFRYSDPVVPQVTSQLARDLWIYILLGTLGCILFLELLLIGRGRDRSEITALDADPEDGTVYILGCTACGTVFEHQGGRGSRFRCTNCMREGQFKGGSHVQAPITHKQCTRCGNAFDAYHAEAECPVCHLRQAVV